MRGRTMPRLVSLVILTGVLAGCAGHKAHKAPAVASGEPPLDVTVDPDGASRMAAAGGGSDKNFGARHPLFYKPHDYYTKTNSNALVKAGAATFVGVPAGVVGEVKQLVTGKPGVRY